MIAYTDFVSRHNIEIHLSYYTISFVVNYGTNPKHLVFNCIVLLVKYYIFSSKYKQQLLTINGFLNLLIQTREFEEYIAFSKNKLDIHHKNGT